MRLRRQGDIAVRGKYDKNNRHVQLYCRTYGKRFAATQAYPNQQPVRPAYISRDYLVD